MTTVNAWKSLVFETKIYILIALFVLDFPLREIKTTKLNEQHIIETDYY